MLFGKTKKPDSDIVILKQTQPDTCGGTDATLDRAAPREIASDALLWFDGESVLPYLDRERRDDGSFPACLGFVHAFAAAAGEGTFLFLSTGEERHGERTSAWALVKGDFMPDLARLIREQELAAHNGYHSQTHGLPENFGGSVRARYATGEKLSFADNQSPVLSRGQGQALADWFAARLKEERLPLPDLAGLVALRFEERRDDGGFTEVDVTLNADGSARVARRRRFDDPTVYEKEATFSPEQVADLKATAEQAALLARQYLPVREYPSGSDKTLTFRFADGEEIAVRDDRVVPGSLSDGFFRVELALTALS